MKYNEKISSKRRTQRRNAATMPLHKSKKNLSAPLSRELRKKEKKRSGNASKGSKVKVLVGRFRGMSGKVLSANGKRGTITVENAVVKKQNGREEPVAIRASNVVILELAESSKGERKEKPTRQPAAKPTPAKMEQKIEAKATV